jgi:DNA polymerase III delta prime subunit
MHRASEPTIVWIEGADVLTPEAQAFLRRIIETCSKHVEFVLETRDETRISIPIRSRCVSIYFTDISYRQQQYKNKLITLPSKIVGAIRNAEAIEEKWLEEAKNDHVRAIIKAREQSLNPASLLEKVLNTLPTERKDIYRRAWGSGRSVWALLALACCEEALVASK